MTTPRTIHRRMARIRSKQRAMDRQRRWEALTPSQQKMETDIKASWAAINRMMMREMVETLTQSAKYLTRPK